MTSQPSTLTKDSVAWSLMQTLRTVLVVTLIFLVGGAVLCSAQAPVENALNVLRTSLDRKERQEAFRILGEQKQLPPSVGPELGRMIVAGGPEAAAAAHLLPRMSDAALPIITKLMESPYTFDTHMILSQTAWGWNPSNEMAYVEAMLPLLRRRPGNTYYPAALAISSLRLSVTNAAAMSREMLRIKSYALHFLAATRVAEQACGWEMHPGDDALFREMQGSDYATVQYAGAGYEERVRVMRWNGGKRAPPPLTPAEKARREQVQQHLNELASSALKECLDLLKTAYSPGEKLSLLYGLQLISPHVQNEKESMARALKQVQVERGSLLDQAFQLSLQDLERRQ